MEKIGTPQRLLDAAETELITNQGFLEMAAVAKRAKASVGLAYHHFGSKTGLIAAVIDRFYGPVRDIALGDAIPVELEWMAREKARVQALIDYFYGHPLAPLVAGRLARDPEVLDIEQAHMDALLEEGARNIAQGQHQGVVEDSLCPDTIVALLMGGLRLAIDRALLADPRPDPNDLLEQIWQFSQAALQPKTSQARNTGGDRNVRKA
ncbi:MAG: TetR/AcrR family transcriptional regulator [Pseudomonadota bacterium]